MDSMYVIEYSVRQDCFHVASLKETLETNLRTATNFIDNDYRILALCETSEEALKKADVLRQLIEDKKRLNVSNSK